MVGEEVSIFTVSKRRRVGEAAGIYAIYCDFKALENIIFHEVGNYYLESCKM